MSVEKSVKFSFVLDETSFQKVKRALNELTADAQKFAKSLQGPGTGGLFGGANVGKPPTDAGTRATGGPRVQTQIGQVVLDNANAFKNMANLGQQSLKGLTDALRRSVDDQRRYVRGLQESLDALGRTYERLDNKSRAAQQVQSKMVEIGGKLTGERDRLGRLQGMMPKSPELLPDVPWPQEPTRNRFMSWLYQPGQGGGGPGGGGTGTSPSFFGGAVKGLTPGSDMAGWLRVGGLIAAGVSGAINEAMSGTRMYSGVEAGRSKLVTGDIRRARGGDVTGMIARQDLLRDADRRRDLLAQVGGPVDMGLLGSYSGVANLQNTGGAIGKGAIGSIIGNGGSIATNLANKDTVLAENAQEQIRNYENSAEFLPKKMALERFYGDFGSRVGAGRILGLGLNYKKGLRGLGGRNGFGGLGGTEMEDTFGMEAARLHRQGYDISQSAAAVQQSRALGMGGAGAGAMMAASAMGWGQYGDIMANSLRGVAGRAGVPAAARNLVGAAMGTSSNTAASMQIGQMAFGFDPRGTTSGLGLMSAIQGGFGFGGGIGDMNTVSRIQAGLDAGNRLSGGFDPYQRGRNLVSAIGVNAGGSTYSQDYLANGMSFKQLLDAAKGDVTVTGRALGINQGMARQQLGAMGGSVFDRFVDQGGDDPMSKAIRGFRASHKGLPEYLSGLSKQKGGRGQAEALGAFLGQEMGVGEEGGLGLVGMFSGIDMNPNKLRRRGGPGGRLGAGETSKLGAEADEMVKDAHRLADMGQQMIESFASIPDEVKRLSAFATNLSESAETFVKSLNGLSDAINDTVDNIRNGKRGPTTPPSSGATATAPTGTGTVQAQQLRSVGIKIGSGH